MTSPTAALVLFGTCALLMLLVGAQFQAADLQYGLIGSELVALGLPALIVAIWMLRRPASPDPLSLARPGFGWAGYGWLIATSIALSVAANVLTGLLAVSLGPLSELAAAYEVMFMSLMFPDDPIRRIAAIVAVVIVAPICEEALFRGVILPLQRDGIRAVAAVVFLNGLLFGLIHMNPLSFVALVGVGAFFAHLAVLSGSLWPSIIAHATLNLVNGVIAPRLLEQADAATDPTATTYAIAALVFIPLTALMWRAGARRFGAGTSNDA